MEKGKISVDLSNFLGGDVNPMIPGRKIYAIFGFCDIHNFSVANEVLQEVCLVMIGYYGVCEWDCGYYA